jgi:ABC-type glutathione transport system ATPase component
VAVAIGLANNPKILLADEPTGEVDSRTAMMLLDVLRDARDSFGVTVIIVTHDQRVSRKVDRVVAIRDGRTSSELVRRRSYAEEMADMKDGDTHEELAVVDRTGRLQIPRDILDSAGVRSQVRVELDDGRIVLTPPRGPGKA